MARLMRSRSTRSALTFVVALTVSGALYGCPELMGITGNTLVVHNQTQDPITFLSISRVICDDNATPVGVNVLSEPLASQTTKSIGGLIDGEYFLSTERSHNGGTVRLSATQSLEGNATYNWFVTPPSVNRGTFTIRNRTNELISEKDITSIRFRPDVDGQPLGDNILTQNVVPGQSVNISLDAPTRDENPLGQTYFFQIEHNGGCFSGSPVTFGTFHCVNAEDSYTWSWRSSCACGGVGSNIPCDDPNVCID